MVEDVKERGGSGYVVDKVKGVLAEYCFIIKRAACGPPGDLVSVMDGKVGKNDAVYLTIDHGFEYNTKIVNILVILCPFLQKSSVRDEISNGKPGC